MPRLPQNNNFAKPLQYLEKEVRDEVLFFVWISIKVFSKLIILYMMNKARHAQST